MSTTPAVIVGREAELEELQAVVDNAVKTGKSQCVYISGAPGTGKSAVIKRIMADNTKMRPLYLNCMSFNGSLKSTLVDCLAKTKKRGAKLTSLFTTWTMVVLDEMDQLTNVTEMYEIFELVQVPSVKLVLIGVANCLDLTDRILPRLSTIPGCKPHLINFTPYTESELVDIIKHNLRHMVSSFEPIAIIFVAKKVSTYSGDVRKALDICLRAYELCSLERRSISAGPLSPRQPGSNISVSVVMVAKVVDEVYGDAEIKSDGLTLQQKLLLCSLVVLNKRSMNLRVLLSTYTRICASQGVDGVDQSEFLSLCQLLESRKLLSVKRAKSTPATQLQLREPLAVVEKVLNDQVLLGSIMARDSKGNVRKAIKYDE